MKRFISIRGVKRLPTTFHFIRKSIGLKAKNILGILSIFFSILLYREWNCEICRADVDQFSNFMSSDSTIGTFVKSLNGEMLCKDPSLEMDEEEIEACQNFVSTFLPVALKELFAVFDSTEACREYFNAC